MWGHLGLDYFKTHSMLAMNPAALRNFVVMLRKHKLQGKTVAYFEFGERFQKYARAFKDRSALGPRYHQQQEEYRRIIRSEFKLLRIKKMRNSTARVYRIR